MVAILGALLLLYAHITLASGRFSPNLRRSTGVHVASRNDTKLSGDVSLCPGSSLD